jgi:hypothetical protein
MEFGTIPDCTGFDHDDFIDRGAEIEIRLDRLGTLRCLRRRSRRNAPPREGTHHLDS